MVLGVVSGARSISGVDVGNRTDDLADSSTDRGGLAITIGLVGIASAVLLVMIIRQLTARHLTATREACPQRVKHDALSGAPRQGRES